MKDKSYEIALNLKYVGYHRRLVSMVYKLFLIKKIVTNKTIAQKLYKPVTQKLKKRTFYLRLKDNNWVADLAEIGSLFSKNWSIKYLLCLIDVFTKMLGLNVWRTKRLKQFFMVLSK